jgi:hypothetical protein
VWSTLSDVLSLFGRRRRKAVDAPTLSSRDTAFRGERVALAELTPPVDEFLGRAAYLQLSLFETASQAAQLAPTVAAKRASAAIAEFPHAKHRALVQLIEERDGDPVALMEPYGPALDRFRAETTGADWHEALITSYVCAGLLDDFFAALGQGLPKDLPQRVAAILEADDAERHIVAELRWSIDATPRLASRLALWGRRLVGDAMLVARAATEQGDEADSRLEPVFTELIGAHTRRMDKLGLTA